MTTEHIRNALKHAGSRGPHPLMTGPADDELKAIEEACKDFYLHGFRMSDKSRDVLDAVGRYVTNEEATK